VVAPAHGIDALDRNTTMKLSRDRILTTHVGSLPRTEAVADALLKKERGEPYDAAAYEATIREGVTAVVRRQADLGIDVVSDGEMSKIAYSTYIQDRLSGFGGDTQRKISADLVDYPDFRQKMARMAGTQPFKRASCIGPIAVSDTKPLERDLANFRAALSGARVTEAFLNAASPGLVTAFQPNEYYPSHEAYVRALGESLRAEYEAIVAAGFVLQLDCPDLAMARHTTFQDISESEFVARAALHVDVLNDATRNIPADAMRMHICWGNYEGPHDHDIDLEKILPIVLKAKPAAILFEAANPRHEHEWTVWRDAKIPPDKVLIPGLLDTSTNYVEHPELVAQRICRFAEIVGRERVIAGTDCGFGTFAGYGKMDPEISYKKLGALVAGAALASKRLWA
jgi:5-methyltetrahydropteroyltriglutamate--homocysteine methyltransferase